MTWAIILTVPNKTLGRHFEYLTGLKFYEGSYQRVRKTLKQNPKRLLTCKLVVTCLSTNSCVHLLCSQDTYLECAVKVRSKTAASLVGFFMKTRWDVILELAGLKICLSD